MNHDLLNYLIPALGLLVFIVVSGTILLLIPKKKKSWEKLKIKTIQEKIQTALDDLPIPQQTKTFASSLSSASCNIYLQKPKLKFQSKSNRDVPEKYKFFTKMAARGMDPDDIASVLDISSAESSQLIHLSQLTRGHLIEN